MKSHSGRIWHWVLIYLGVVLWILIMFPVFATSRHPGPSPWEGFIVYALAPSVFAIYLIVFTFMKFKTRWPHLIVAGIIICMIVYSGKMTLDDMMESEARRSCISQTKQLTLAVLMYADDWDGYLPLADNWVDATQPYLKDWNIFKCGSDKSGARSSYAMNRNLSGKKLSDITDLENTVLLYETNRPGDNPSGTGEDMATQHNDGCHMGFTDGHVRWFAGKNFRGHAPNQPNPHW